MPSPAAELPAPSDTEDIELSVVIPCLNEADTIEVCVRKALKSMEAMQLKGEVVVADNGSADGSVELARAAGARAIHVSAKGYGNALIGGIQAARGRYILMGDADDSYDFSNIEGFVKELRNGCDLAQGCRLPAGGGTVMPGAMPFLHRWWGNPMFTWLARWWFRSPVNDVYCGLRGFRKDFYETLDLRCTGMEFATEMIIKSSLRKARVAEVPITLHPDGRKAHAPHLRTFRDGWRTLRFFMLYTPRWLFLFPGILAMLLGLAGYAVALPGLTFNGITFDAHTLLFSSLAILSGYQAALFGIFTKTYAVQERLHPPDERMERFHQVVTLERGLVAGVLALLGGLTLLLLAVNQWRVADFGRLDYAVTMRLVIPGATLTTLALQTIFSSFLLSLLRIHRR